MSCRGHWRRDRSRQLLAHAQPCLVDRDVVDDRVGACEIDVLEDARRVPGVPRALADVNGPVHRDDDRLARGEVALQLEPEQVEGDALRGHDILLALGGLPGSEADRADRVRIAERDHAIPGDERHRRVAAHAPLVNPRHRVEDRVRVELERMGAGELAGEDVEQQLGIRLRVDVAELLPKHRLAQLTGVDQVAVVRQGDTVGGIDVERLCLVGGFASRGRIADVPDAHRAPERVHVVRLEHVAHHSVALALTDRPVAGHDAGRVLPAMLQRGERVDQILADVGTSDDSDDPAHVSRSPRVTNSGAGPRRGGDGTRIYPVAPYRRTSAPVSLRSVSRCRKVKPLSPPGAGLGGGGIGVRGGLG